MVRKEGIASSGFRQLILVSGITIKEPTNTSAIELAIDGIMERSGEKNMNGRNSRPADSQKVGAAR